MAAFRPRTLRVNSSPAVCHFVQVADTIFTDETMSFGAAEAAPAAALAEAGCTVPVISTW